MPGRYVFETPADVPPDRLFRAIIDVCRWPEWDPDLALVEHDGEELRPGSVFMLTPKSGPRTHMTVEIAEAPSRFVDVASLPLSSMRTSHEFLPIEAGLTLIRVTIETAGPLAFLWDRLIARKQAAGAAEQTRRFAAFAGALR
jgi:hypothetical protein